VFVGVVMVKVVVPEGIAHTGVIYARFVGNFFPTI